MCGGGGEWGRGGAVSLNTPGHPRTLQDSIICIFNILYERVDDGLVLVCLCII